VLLIVEIALGIVLGVIALLVIPYVIAWIIIFWQQILTLFAVIGTILFFIIHPEFLNVVAVLMGITAAFCLLYLICKFISSVIVRLLHCSRDSASRLAWCSVLLIIFLGVIISCLINDYMEYHELTVNLYMLPITLVMPVSIFAYSVFMVVKEMSAKNLSSDQC